MTISDTSPAHRWWLAALVVVCLASAIALQAARDVRYPNIASPVDELYFTSGDSIGRMSLSFKPLLADLYWIRAVQYFGGTRIAAQEARDSGREAPVSHYDLLYPLLDVTTTLDPQFNIAYRFGSIFLAEGYPNGPGQPQLAIKLLDKGFAANPTKWQYVYDKAFVYYWSVRDYQQSAHWFSEAAKIKGSPSWMPGLAAFMLGQGGDRRSSRFLWQQIHDTAEQQTNRQGQPDDDCDQHAHNQRTRPRAEEHVHQARPDGFGRRWAQQLRMEDGRAPHSSGGLRLEWRAFAEVAIAGV
jgi:tetratricopeptide (TPR) repeat protein